MRIEACVAFLVSIALHAGILFVLSSVVAPRANVGVNPDSPTVVTARLKNTMSDEETPVLKRSLGSAAPVDGMRPAKKETRVANAQRFYPLQAIKNGIEGEAIVLLRIDERGRLLDARIARSSGYAILDQAALRAVHAAPRFASGAREILFPVTFALH